MSGAALTSLYSGRSHAYHPDIALHSRKKPSTTRAYIFSDYVNIWYDYTRTVSSRRHASGARRTNRHKLADTLRVPEASRGREVVDPVGR